MKKLSLLTLLVFLAIFSNAQSSEDSQKTLNDGEISKKIVGTWIVDLQTPNGTSVKGTATIVSDNSFSSKAIMAMGDKKQELSYEGTWEVKNGFLVETIGKSNSKLIPVGKVTRDKIIHVNDQELVYRTEQGKIETRKRGK